PISRQIEDAPRVRGEPGSEHLIGIDPDRKATTALRGRGGLIVEERRRQQRGQRRSANAGDQKRRAALWRKAREQYQRGRRRGQRERHPADEGRGLENRDDEQ